MMANPMMGNPMMGGHMMGNQMMANPMQAGAQPWYSQYYNRMPQNEIQQLQQWFFAMDRDRSGSIAVHELAQATFFGQQLGLPAARKFIQAFDKDRSGQIDFTEYAAMHGFIMQMSQIFFQNVRCSSLFFGPIFAVSY
jgi:Ca2+-binding EF-hand superfamily protein